MGKVSAIALGLLGLVAGCVDAGPEELEWRLAADTDSEGDSTGGWAKEASDGSGSWTTKAWSSSSTGDDWSSTGADTGGTDDTGGSSSGTGATIKLVMEDLEYARVEQEDDPWPVKEGVDVFPSVPGCIEIYQYTCDGFKKPPWADECMISGEGGFLRDFYTDPECVPFQQPDQVIVSCDAFCGDGGGSCVQQQIECGVGVVQSAYCKCHAK